MRRNLIPAALLACANLCLATTSQANPRDDVLATYAQSARALDPAFGGFSSARGERLHAQTFTSGKPDTPACTSCHGSDARRHGQSPSGKAIAPMAASVNPPRYADPAKVEKWFLRNCSEVLGRACTSQEKGDWLTYMLSQ